jgi:flagellar hook-associated protein 1 FlgK
MAGLGLLMQIGTSALKSHTYGTDVTAHNIANLHTEGYSRQTAVTGAKEGLKLGNLVLGQGIVTTEIKRNVDDILDKRLMEHKSDLSKYDEIVTNMETLEGFFSETGALADTSISAMLSKFSNGWESLANNPSGSSERVTLFEQSSSMAERFRTLYSDIRNFQIDLTRTIDSAVSDINITTKEIAEINGKLFGMEVDSALANDMRDKRDLLISDLHEHLNIQTFVQENGFITVTGPKGTVLVNGRDSYNLDLIADSKTGLGDVYWENSSGGMVDITSGITKGDIGGWLELRDTILEGYNQDFDNVVKDLIWNTNTQHSQGVGLELFTPSDKLEVRGSYYTIDEDKKLKSLVFGDRVDFGSENSPRGFDIWIGDSNGDNARKVRINLADTRGGNDPISGESTMEDLATSINNQLKGAGITGVTAQAVYGSGDSYIPPSLDEEEEMAQVPGAGVTLRFSTVDKDGNFTGKSFGFSNDDSSILSALGINTFFAGQSLATVNMKQILEYDKSFIAAGEIRMMKDTSYTVAKPLQITTLSSTGKVNSIGPYEGVEEAIYRVEISSPGIVDRAETKFKWTKSLDGGVTWSDESAELGTDGSIELDNGIKVTFGDGKYENGEIYEISTIDGVISSSDNENAIKISESTSGVQDDYHNILAEIGVKSSTTKREMNLIKIATEQLQELRDGVSGVSLDEEFTNLIKFQRAYQAASKIIQTADDMMMTAVNLMR